MVLKQSLQCVLAFPPSPLSSAGLVQVAVTASPTPGSCPWAELQALQHNGRADLHTAPGTPSPCHQSLFPAAHPSKDHVGLAAGWPLFAPVSGRRKIIEITPGKQKPNKAASVVAVPETSEFLLPAHPCGVANYAAESGCSSCLPARGSSPLLLIILFHLGRLQRLSHRHTSHPHFTSTVSHALSCQEKLSRPI